MVASLHLCLRSEHNTCERNVFLVSWVSWVCNVHPVVFFWEVSFRQRPKKISKIKCQVYRNLRIVAHCCTLCKKHLLRLYFRIFQPSVVSRGGKLQPIDDIRYDQTLIRQWSEKDYPTAILEKKRRHYSELFSNSATSEGLKIYYHLWWPHFHKIKTAAKQFRGRLYIT